MPERALPPAASHVRMTDATRFQFRLPAAQCAQLEDLANQCGLSSAALTRLAISRLLMCSNVGLNRWQVLSTALIGCGTALKCG